MASGSEKWKSHNLKNKTKAKRRRPRRHRLRKGRNIFGKIAEETPF